MIFKILKEYIRRISRNYKIYAVSILGMSIAVIASFHIYHFVFKELSVDAFHSNRKEIYRVVNKQLNANTRDITIALPLGELLKDKLPEVVEYSRIRTVEDMKLTVSDNMFKTRASYIDPTFFELFNFSLIHGSIQKFKDTHNGIIITEKIANTLYKNKNPIGETITISEDYKEKNVLLEIVGVMNNIPEASTIKGDYFINLQNHEKTISADIKWAGTGGSQLYIYAPKLHDFQGFSEKASRFMFEKFKAAIKTFTGESVDQNFYEFDVQRLDTIYFDSSDIFRQKHKGNIKFLRIILFVGLLTLFLATSNYIIMNLGLNMNRVKEFKTRRHLGATKGLIFTKVITESMLNAGICFILTLITYPIIGDYVRQVIGFDYELSLTNDLILLISYLGIILCLGLITGALEFTLSYKTIFSEKEGITVANSWGSKKIMIVSQLFLFLSLMICIFFVKKQISFIQNKDLGYNVESLVNIPTRNFKELKGILDSKSYVKTTSYSYQLFTSVLRYASIKEAKSNEEIKAITVNGDYNFLEVYGIELLYGENFPPQQANNTSKKTNKLFNNTLTEVLVNEEFVNKIALKDPVGKIFKAGNTREFVIKGVFKNIYNTPLYYPMQPLMVINRDYNGWYYGSLAVSYKKGSKQRLEKELRTFFTSKGVDPYFLEDIMWGYNYQDIYREELQLKRLLEVFTIIVLLIALLGLVAISLFITESKTKEIGIRKVNGASINEIMYMLNKGFIKWVIIAFVLACPIAYYAMSTWMEGFAYKTALSWWVFALAGTFTLIIALLTVSWQTYRAATQNPVDSLRDE